MPGVPGYKQHTRKINTCYSYNKKQNKLAYIHMQTKNTIYSYIDQIAAILKHIYGTIS